MAQHISFDFDRDGFRATVPARYHEIAERLEDVVRPNRNRLVLGRCSIRTFGSNAEPSQFCHYGYLALDPTIQIAVFNVRPNQAAFEFYRTEVLRSEVWENAADTGTKDSARPVFYVVPPGRPRPRGVLFPDEAIARLRMALDDAENALRSGRLSARWAGEAITRRVLDRIDGQWHSQASPDWIHLDGGRLKFDFLDLTEGAQRVVEVMGAQHFAPVELYGGQDGKVRSNKRTLHKVRECQKRGIPLLFIRWHGNSALERLRRQDSGIEEAAEHVRRALLKSAARGCRWIDLDEFVINRRSDDYAFLRRSQIDSAIDSS